MCIYIRIYIFIGISIEITTKPQFKYNSTLYNMYELYYVILFILGAKDFSKLKILVSSWGGDVKLDKLVRPVRPPG